MKARTMFGSTLGPKPPPRGIDLPADDGEPLETSRHRDQMILLIQSLREGWRDRHDFYVSGNMFLYYSETQSKKVDYRGPDLFVVLDTDDHERRSWVIWEEDGRAPNVIIEITSDTTEQIDRGPKMRIYGTLLRVPFYAIFDPFSGQLDGFRYDADHGRYEPIAKDERGYVRCEPLNLWLGVVPQYLEAYRVEAPWLRWIDPKGDPLPEPSERAAKETERAAKEAGRAAKEAERAAKEAERANAAESEVVRLRAEIERLKK
jgi:Uma2 family endonuclease